MTKQIFFIKFPIIFPIIYGFILYSFPEYEKELILITLLLLAETHFGATWPFFLAKSNIEYIKKDYLKLILFPFSIIFFSIIGFFFFKSLFLMIFFMANIYHVTRQSFGVCKLYCKNNSEVSFQESFIYIFNFIFFIIAFFRFYIPVINEGSLILLNLIILTLFASIFVTYVSKFGFTQNFLTFATGVVIYPTCFVVNPVHAIIMGVTMHYSQYLYLTKYVVTERTKEQDKNPRRSIFKNYFFIIIIYSTIMTSFSYFGNNTNVNLNSLILIPIIGQMLHFYLDSQLWKFSFAHNRENVLKYILSFTNK